MDKEMNDLEPSISSVVSSDQGEGTSNIVRLPKVLLERIDEKTLLSFQNPKSKKTKKRTTKVSDKVQKALKKSPTKANETVLKRARGRPRKLIDEPVSSKTKKDNLKIGVKNKNTTSTNKSPLLKKSNLKLRVKLKPATSNKRLSKDNNKSKPSSVLKKTVLQKRSKVIIPLAKKPKVSPNTGAKPNSRAEVKQSPPKPKLKVIQTKLGESSSDTSGDEFLYDELIEELEKTANKIVVSDKPVPEKTTITLKPNSGNKPPTVLKGGIIKRTDLPPDLSSFAPSNNKSSKVMTNGLQKSKQTSVLTPGGKRKSSDIVGPKGSAKKSSPWPVALTPSHKKNQASSLNNQKNKEFTPKVSAKATSTISPKTTYSPFTTPEDPPETSFLSNSVTLGMSKAKIGPKQTAKVVPLSKSFDADESDEYLEEETLECDLDVYELPKVSQVVSDAPKSHLPETKPSEKKDTNQDLINILTDESEEILKAKSNEAKNKSVESKTNLPKSRIEEEVIKQASMDSYLAKTSEEIKALENEEANVRTIYDLMKDVFTDYPSWNLHLIPETSAFCIAQVTKGRLGLPTLKKCIELDPDTYNAKVYIHQYHIKRFDGVYDGEESILALIREIDSIKA